MKQPRGADLGQFARTVRHLGVSQVLHRVRLRAQRSLYGVHQPTTERVFDAAAPSSGTGWPVFEPLDARLEATGHPSPEANLRGRFELLNQGHDLGEDIDWNTRSASQLWRYHLHYFDWVWDLPAHPEREWGRAAYRQLYASWVDANPVGQWDAWSPYVVSLRAWTMCAVHAALVAGEPWEPAYVSDLARHARYLRANVEFDVGGNHLVKNLKALVGLGIFLRDDALLRFGLGHLRREVAVQVLSDGGHFERSPSYHAQVLGDLRDVIGLGRAAGLRPSILAPFEDAMQRMQAWLAAMLLPDGAVPLLNDCLPVAAKRLQAVGVERGRPVAAPLLLPSSGYSVMADDGSLWHVVMDVGPPCPPDLPAHAHADALAVICILGEESILVDTGTSTYAGDLDRRQYERSTLAHNTVVIDGQDSTEVYGAFRAGRRHRVTVEDVTPDGITAVHDGYRYLTGRPVHRRHVRIDGGDLLIEDTVDGASGHDLTAYFHLAPGLHPRVDDHGVVDAGPVRFEFGGESPVHIEVVEPGTAPFGLVGRGHGVLEPSACLVVSFSGRDTAVLRTRLAG